MKNRNHFTSHSRHFVISDARHIMYTQVNHLCECTKTGDVYHRSLYAGIVTHSNTRVDICTNKY